MPTDRSFRIKLLAAFLSVYIVWGSTYLVILFAIESIPPWSMTALRFIAASLVMGAIALFKKESPLTKDQFKISAFSGVLLVTANGVVCVIEKWVPSGIAAVVIGAMPIWIMLIGWAAFQTGRPQLRKIIGALVGLFGIGLIAVGDTSSKTTGLFGAYAPLVLCVSSLLWATGTLVQRKALNVVSGFKFLSAQMMSGAVIALVFSFGFEAPLSFDWSQVSTKSWLALFYLIVFGSLIGFTAYSWLSRNVEPHLVSTYALVNPIIAVWLGWFLANEQLTPTFLSATALVLVGLVLLMFRSKRPEGLDAA